jgi:hypothetical protein
LQTIGHDFPAGPKKRKNLPCNFIQLLDPTEVNMAAGPDRGRRLRVLQVQHQLHAEADEDELAIAQLQEDQRNRGNKMSEEEKDDGSGPG